MTYYGPSTRTNGLNPGQHRDTQRSRLYEADDVLNGLRVSRAARKHLTDSVRHSRLRTIGPDGPQALYHPSIASVQDYVDTVLAASWFRRRWGLRTIDVSHSHGYGSSARSGGDVSMGVEHRRWEATILHEVAHTLTPHPYAHHGPEFAGILLTLVRHVMGAEPAATLRESFKANKVRYSMRAVPKGDEGRRTQADRRAESRGIKPPRTTRTPAVDTTKVRKPPKRLETAEEMYEAGRKAALRGSDWDRAESAALSRATGDMRYEKGRRAFSRGFGEVVDAGERPNV